MVQISFIQLDSVLITYVSHIWSDPPLLLNWVIIIIIFIIDSTGVHPYSCDIIYEQPWT